MTENNCTLWPEFDFTVCCWQHDRDFASDTGFWEANWRLFKCIQSADPVMAVVVLIGVCLFGWYFRRRARRRDQ